MNIIPRKPFQDLDNFFYEDDWFFPVFSKNFSKPEMDIYETEKDVVVEISSPKTNPENIKISLEDGILKIFGEEKEEKEEKNKNYWKKEISKGSFQRTVRIPAEVDEENIEAVYEKGTLKIVMEKTSSKKKNSKDIKIKVK